MSTTVANTRQSVRMLQRRGSGLLRTDAMGRLDIGASGSSGSGVKAATAAALSDAGSGSGSHAASRRFMGFNHSRGGRNKSGGAPQIGPAKTGGTTDGSTGGRETIGDSASGHSLQPSSAPAMRGAGLVGEGGGQGRGRRRGGGGGSAEEKEGKKKKKTAAARIGEVLSGLPLSKLKIVVGGCMRACVEAGDCFRREKRKTKRQGGEAWRQSKAADRFALCAVFCFVFSNPPVPFWGTPVGVTRFG